MKQQCMATSEIVSPSSEVSQALCDGGRKQTITTAIVWQTLDNRQHGGAAVNESLLSFSTCVVEGLREEPCATSGAQHKQVWAEGWRWKPNALS